MHIGSLFLQGARRASPPPSRRPLVSSAAVPLRNVMIRIGAVGLNVARTCAYFYTDEEPLRPAWCGRSARPLLTRCLHSPYTLLHAAFHFFIYLLGGGLSPKTRMHSTGGAVVQLLFCLLLPPSIAFLNVLALPSPYL